MNRSIILCKTLWYVHRMLSTFMIQACSALDYSYKCFMFIEFCIVITLFLKNKSTSNFASPLAQINRFSEFVLNIIIYFFNCKTVVLNSSFRSRSDTSMILKLIRLLGVLLSIHRFLWNWQNSLILLLVLFSLKWFVYLRNLNTKRSSAG